MAYYPGSVALLTFEIRDPTDVLVDPQTVTVELEAPDKTVTTPLVVRQSVGTYSTDLAFDQVGLYNAVMVGHGTYSVVKTAVINVDPLPFTL